MKRFYEQAAVAETGDGFAVALDGRTVRTPKGQALVLPSRALADAIAAEWNGQGEELDPAAMPMLRFANTVLDGIAPDPGAVAAAILRFGDNDLLCYRAGESALAERQRAAWDPLLGWARQRWSAHLRVTDGISPVEQSPDAREALREALRGYDPFTLAAIQVIAAITGSLILALAVAERRLSPAAAFAVSRIDESWQAEKWGTDAEAAARADTLAREMARAAALMDAMTDRLTESGR
jgi:chaperone required for assembly of F1-ATPase